MDWTGCAESPEGPEQLHRRSGLHRPLKWFPVDGRSVLGSVLRLPLRALPKGWAMTICRGPARGMKWVVGSSVHGCWLGTYELRKQRALEQFVRSGMTVYDIGSQAGFYTLFFSCLVGTGGKVYAFEPFAENVWNWLRHIRMNGVRNAQLIPVAVTAQSGLVGFSIDREKAKNAVVERPDAALLVPALSLDDAVERHELPPPDLIKMDIEGGEAAALAGARRTLERVRPILFVAVHGKAQARACHTLLATTGYRCYSLDGIPLVGAAEADEIYALPDQLQGVAR